MDKKDKVPIQIYVDSDLKNNFDRLATKLSINKSMFLRNYIEEFVEKNKYLLEEAMKNDN